MSQFNQDFINNIKQDIPAHLSVEDFIAYSSRPLRRSIRINTLKISCAEFQALMLPKGWQFDPIPWCQDGFWITGQCNEELGNSIEHLQGLFYIQEASSMLPPTALFKDHTQFDTVLDTASAPGSKTTQIAALMDNQGLLIANEYSASRVKVLHANIARMGVSNTAITHFDGRVFGQYLFETFDAVLLDAPCSGEGTIRKDPDALKHWHFEDIAQIAATQKELMESAFLALKPDGILVYSTCTLNRYENQQVCHHLKQKYPDAVEFIPLDTLFEHASKATTEEGFLHVWPQIFDSEGFFVAAIRKTTSVPREHDKPKAQKQFPFSLADRKQTQAITDYFTTLGIKLPTNKSLMVRDDEYWLFPEGFNTLIGKMRFQRIGIKLADQVKHGFKPRHEAIMSLCSANSNMFDITAEQAVAYLMGRDLPLDTSPKIKGEVIVSHQGKPLGLGKLLPNKLKNNLSRELVKDKVCQL